MTEVNIRIAGDGEVVAIPRMLQLHEVGEDTKIAYVDMISDPDLVVILGDILIEMLMERGIRGGTLLTASEKGVPIAHHIASRYGDFELAVARKTNKKFFGAPLIVMKKSITNDEDEKLFLPEYDEAKLKGSDVIIVDDIYTTGSSIEALRALAEKCKSNVVATMVGLKEKIVDEPDDMSTCMYAGVLPLFNNNGEEKQYKKKS